MRMHQMQALLVLSPEDTVGSLLYKRCHAVFWLNTHITTALVLLISYSSHLHSIPVLQTGQMGTSLGKPVLSATLEADYGKGLYRKQLGMVLPPRRIVKEE